MMMSMMLPFMVMANSATETGTFVKVKKVHQKQRRCSRSSTSSTRAVDDVRAEPTHSASGEPLNQTLIESHTGHHDELAEKLHVACHRKLMDFIEWATFPATVFLVRFPSSFVFEVCAY